MSLTTELSRAASPINRWLNRHLDLQAARAFVRKWNVQMETRRPLSFLGIDAVLAGTAFDYLFRWHVAPLVPEALVATLGARPLGKAHTVRRLVEYGNTHPKTRAQACVWLAHYEGLYRGGERYEQISGLLDLLYYDDLSQIVPPEVTTVEDIERLARTIPEVWRDVLPVSEGWLPNPTFVGSPDVGGADADWILCGTLWDCKASRRRHPFEVAHVKQILGYLLLDYDDVHQIQGVGWYFARQQLRIELSLEEALIEFFWSPYLPDLRAELASYLAMYREEDDDELG